MTDLTYIYEEYLMSVGRFKSTVPLNDHDKFIIFKRGIRRMFIDTGRADKYDPAMYTEAGLDKVEYDIGQDEQHYILLAAQVAFYRQMVADVSQPNRITQHKTDALTVTFSDKSNAELIGRISDLENELRETYHKMPQFVEVLGG